MLTKIKTRFGLLLLNVSERLKRLAGRLGIQHIGPEDTTEVDNGLIIWDVLDGPFHRDIFGEELLEEEDIDDDMIYMLVVRVQEFDQVGFVNFWVKTEEEAMFMVNHFKTSIEPLRVT